MDDLLPGKNECAQLTTYVEIVAPDTPSTALALFVQFALHRSRLRTLLYNPCSDIAVPSMKWDSPETLGAKRMIQPDCDGIGCCDPSRGRGLILIEKANTASL